MHAAGAADCLLETSHVARNRHAFHSNACELHILMHQAYQSCLPSLDKHITPVTQERKGETVMLSYAFTTTAMSGNGLYIIFKEITYYFEGFYLLFSYLN